MATSNRSSSSPAATDLIAAPVTPAGYGGIAGIRISGPGSIRLAGNLLGRDLPDRHAETVDLLGIDRGVAIAFRAPRSYTGEDVVELYSHGNPVIVSLLMQRIVEAGARPARPGEFTRRALVNGKIDLIQAESVQHLVEAGDEHSIRQAMAGLSGVLSERVENVRRIIIGALSMVQAAMEFPEDELDIDEEEIALQIRTASRELERLEETSRQHTGSGEIRVVIAGPSNAGKSTIFNGVTGKDAAIVSGIAGTTRDTLTERIHLHGCTVLLQDTAGIRDSRDQIEREGIRRSMDAVQRAHAVLFVIDAASWDEAAAAWWERIDPSGRCLVFNKVDLAGAPSDLPDPSISISALAEGGIDSVRTVLAHWIGEEVGRRAAGEFLLSLRQEECLREGRKALAEAGKAMEEGIGEEITEFHLRRGAEALEEMIGRITSEDILDRIFHDFCLGK